MTDFPNGTEVLRTWLGSIAECRTERPTNGVLPFITLRRAGGGDDELTDRGRYQVSVFHETESQAMDVAKSVRIRLRALASRFGGQSAVTLPDGDVYVDHVVFNEGFRPEAYAAEPTVRRVRAVVEVHVRVA